jgi:hypothetical protein
MSQKLFVTKPRDYHHITYIDEYPGPNPISTWPPGQCKDIVGWITHRDLVGHGYINLCSALQCNLCITKFKICATRTLHVLAIKYHGPQLT